MHCLFSEHFIRKVKSKSILKMQIDKKKFWFNVVSVHWFYINSSAQNVIFREWVFKSMLALSWNSVSNVYCFVSGKDPDKILQKHYIFLTSYFIWSGTCWFFSERNFTFFRNSSFSKMEGVLSSFTGLDSLNFLLSCTIFIYTFS